MSSRSRRAQTQRKTDLPEPVKGLIKKIEEDAKALSEKARQAVEEIEKARKRLQELVTASSTERR